jgi:hypothetical protein
MITETDNQAVAVPAVPSDIDGLMQGVMGADYLRNRDPVAVARECFAALAEGNPLVLYKSEYTAQYAENPEFIVNLLKVELARAHKDASALDPTGRKTSEEMDEELRKVAEARYVAEARRYFTALKDGTRTALSWIPGDDDSFTDNPRYVTTALRRSLELAHRDASALDPEGRKSAAEMEDEIKKGVVPRTHLTDAEKRVVAAEARVEAKLLKTGGVFTESMGGMDASLRQIHTQLKQAGLDASALDSEHKRSAAEMDDALQADYNLGKIRREQKEQGVVDPNASDKDMAQSEEGVWKALKRRIAEGSPAPSGDLRMDAESFSKCKDSDLETEVLAYDLEFALRRVGGMNTDAIRAMTASMKTSDVADSPKGPSGVPTEKISNSATPAIRR